MNSIRSPENRENERRSWNTWLTGVQSPTSHLGQLCVLQTCVTIRSSGWQLLSDKLFAKSSTHCAVRCWTPPLHEREHWNTVGVASIKLIPVRSTGSHLRPRIELPMCGFAGADTGLGVRNGSISGQVLAVAGVHHDEASGRWGVLFALFGHVDDAFTAVDRTGWSVSNAPPFDNF